MTTTEAAKVLGVSPGRMRQFVAEGRLPSRRIGRDNFIHVTGLRVLANQLRSEAGGKRGPKPKLLTEWDEVESRLRSWEDRGEALS